MSYEWQFGVVLRNADLLLSGMGVSLGLSLCSVAIGWLVALIIMLGRVSELRWARWASRAYIDLFRGAPVLVTLVWLYFCLPLISDVRIPAFGVAVLALSLNYSALEAEILRSGLEAIPREQIEVARLFGFSRWTILSRLVVPQTFWRSLGPTLGQAINTLKLSALASFITVQDVFYVTEGLVRDTFRPLELYTTLAFAYLTMIIPLSFLVQSIENRLNARYRSA